MYVYLYTRLLHIYSRTRNDVKDMLIAVAISNIWPGHISPNVRDSASNCYAIKAITSTKAIIG